MAMPETIQIREPELIQAVAREIVKRGLVGIKPTRMAIILLNEALGTLPGPDCGTRRKPDSVFAPAGQPATESRSQDGGRANE